MLRFLAGVLVVCASVTAWSLTMQPLVAGEARTAAWLVGMLVALPVGTAWVVAEALDRWTPRRAFDRRVRGVRGGVALVGAGMLSAVIAYVIATLMLAVVEWLPDVGVMILSMGCTSALVLLCFGRKRAGACVHCLYELEPAQARCPECGAIGSAA